jgi:hypothetical protein
MMISPPPIVMMDDVGCRVPVPVLRVARRVECPDVLLVAGKC